MPEVEQSKVAKRPTSLDNPSELIKLAQRESVMNNSSSKEESNKGEETTDMECYLTVLLSTVGVARGTLLPEVQLQSQLLDGDCFNIWV